MKKGPMGRMMGTKAATNKTAFAKPKALAHDNPPGFEMDAKKATGKRATMPMKKSAPGNVSKKPRAGGKAASRGVIGMKSRATSKK